MYASKAEDIDKAKDSNWPDYFGHNIHEIRFFDLPAANRALNLVNGNHCLAELLICKKRVPYDCKKIWLDNGATE